MLDGDNTYYCEPLKKKVAAVKRTCFDAVPKNLILHLKTFEFDYGFMRKIKVNERCEFPTHPDIYPYTKEAINDEERSREPKGDKHLWYQLVGILVHIGTADSGHYYSHIQKRSFGMRSRPAWFHFNGTQIDPFDHEDIPRACLGGYEASNQWSSVTGTDMQQPRSCTQPMQHSTYMLFYEQCDVNEARKSHPLLMSKDNITEETLEHPPMTTSPVPQPFLDEV